MTVFSVRVDMIGLHLIVDGVVKDDVNKETISHILSELPSLIGMHILSGPHIVMGVPENPGWTGFDIIDKSHIAIHTFSETCVVSIDVYSCKSFKTEEVTDYLRQHLDYLQMREIVLNREV
jgi:S-adenosylmethionine/arginine decarboxylase-like enzyme